MTLQSRSLFAHLRKSTQITSKVRKYFVRCADNKMQVKETVKKAYISNYYWKCTFPMNPYVRLLDGWLVISWLFIFELSL